MMYEPVDMTYTPEQQLVTRSRLDVDDSEPVGSVDGDQVDFGARHARDRRINCSQVRFKRAGAFSESGS
jgi:hypothetical protein